LASYIHDGRAATLDSAIRNFHKVEAQASHDAYVALSADNQSRLLEFLGSLGRIEDVGRAKVDLGYFDIFQTSAFLDFFIPTGTLVQHGGYLVIARNATQSAFQTFYGRTLGSNVTFINAAATGQSFPRLNGSETFTLFDSQFVIMDGPTIPEPLAGLQTFSRRNCDTNAGASASWIQQASSVAVATPGSGLLSSGQSFVCVSEVADVGGGGPVGFEFIEIFVE
jgi:hypothetical protein